MCSEVKETRKTHWNLSYVTTSRGNQIQGPTDTLCRGGVTKFYVYIHKRIRTYVCVFVCVYVRICVT